MNSLEQIFTTITLTLFSFLGLNIEEHKDTFPKIVQKISTLTEYLPQEEIVTIPEVKQENRATKIEPIIQKPKQPFEKNDLAIIPKPVVSVSTPSQAKPENYVTIDQKIKSAVGNIFCTVIEAGKVQKITGSAVAISNNGVLLTNAHIAKYILIENTKIKENISCYVRTGSPAKRAYKASVIYLPTEWVSANKNNSFSYNLAGTGENDYALIVLDEKVSNSFGPDLSFIQTESKKISVGEKIILASYPAFGGNIIDNALYAISEKSEVKEIWPLQYSKSDLFDSSPTKLAVNGSSGGVAASIDGKLLGIIVATTVDSYSGKPNLRLISYSYIEEDIKSKTGKSLVNFIENADNESKLFAASEGFRLVNLLIKN